MDDPPRGAGGAARLARGWLPAVAWAALIFALSAQPGLRVAPDEDVDLIVRKVGHMAVFGILALLVWRGLERTTTLRRPWAWALALTVVYALTDELHQAFVVTRQDSLTDVAIDAIGAVVAVAGLGFLRSRRPPRGQDG